MSDIDTSECARSMTVNFQRLWHLFFINVSLVWQWWYGTDTFSCNLPGTDDAIKNQVGESAENIDAKWRLQQLQTQYDYLVSKTAAQNEASKHADYKIEVTTPPP